MGFRVRQETTDAGDLRSLGRTCASAVMRPVKGRVRDPLRMDIRVYGDGG